MLKFAFVSDAAEREYRDLPGDVQDEFGHEWSRQTCNASGSAAFERLESRAACNGISCMSIRQPASCLTSLPKILDTDKENSVLL